MLTFKIKRNLLVLSCLDTLRGATGIAAGIAPVARVDECNPTDTLGWQGRGHARIAAGCEGCWGGGLEGIWPARELPLPLRSAGEKRPQAPYRDIVHAF